MGSLIETIQKKRFLLIPSVVPYKDELPISSSSSQSSKGEQLGSLVGVGVGGIRKRISSFSVNIQPSLAGTASSAWAFRKSRSMPASLGGLAGGPVIRRWWERSWGWLLPKRPAFAKDVEEEEEEEEVAEALGRHSKGTLGHVLCKVRSEVGRLLLHVVARTDHSALLPTSSTHKQFRHANNFDRAGKTTPADNMSSSISNN